MIYSQEVNCGSSRSLTEIENLSGIFRSSVRLPNVNEWWVQVFQCKKVHLLADTDHDKMPQNVTM